MDVLEDRIAEFLTRRAAAEAEIIKKNIEMLTENKSFDPSWVDFFETAMSGAQMSFGFYKSIYEWIYSSEDLKNPILWDKIKPELSRNEDLAPLILDSDNLECLCKALIEKDKINYIFVVLHFIKIINKL